ncbi:cleavage and polyadenylation specificity factor 30 [Sesamum angolense]|uniref:YTH domain-containing family protein n=1 Tax=Sesamum angolense TaxID=2727404 RepID=A0AAE2BVJ8_9LAMI|nr:cleavage and polyadenylation specificity factor 30 [Sesamum angolense]
MDDGEGGLSFDFEGGLDTGPSHPTASVPVIKSSGDANTASAIAANANYPSAVPTPATQAAEGMVGAGRRSFRQTCWSFDCYLEVNVRVMETETLHRKAKYIQPSSDPAMANGWHESLALGVNLVKFVYKLGFCPNGPDCRYRHAKLPGPPPPVEEVLRKIQQSSYNYGNRFFQNRNTNYAQQTEKSQFPQGPNDANKVAKGSTTESGNLIHPPQQGQLSQQPGSQGQIQNLPNSQQNQASRNATPLTQGTSRYFVVKSCNKENLELSVQQGVWATQRSNEAKLNEAFESVDNVILIFSVNKTRHFQGCAKMTSRIGGSVGGNWKHTHGSAHYGRNFAVKWLKLGELSFNKTRHLRNSYNENLQVKISRDCQELEPSVGEQLASLLYLEPDSDGCLAGSRSEKRRRQEVSGSENPDIVPFEDDEEEEEDESEER